MEVDIENTIALLGIAVTVVIAVVSAVYALVTNTKKYELTENYRCELLAWYQDVVDTMVLIIHYCENGEFNLEIFRKERIELLSKLSSLIEKGRFYFPNVIEGDGFGENKPAAYQGYRHINLEFLVHFYDIASSENSIYAVSSLWNLERHFTSFMFDMIKPRDRNHEYSKHLSIIIPKGESLEDYLERNPKKYTVFK